MRSIVTLLLIAAFGISVGCGETAPKKADPPKPAAGDAKPADAEAK
jgi:hypothetical protein